jgi:hypothetical protein
MARKYLKVGLIPGMDGGSGHWMLFKLIKEWIWLKYYLFRSYYRCTESGCSVKKRVEREATDPGLLVSTYEGTHNHECPSVIYYIGKPIILQQPPGSNPAIILVNPGVCSEAVTKFASQQAL